MNGQTRQRKGKAIASPRVKAKAKARVREDIQEKGNYNQDEAGSSNEDGQRTLGDFGIKRQRVEFVGDVQENADFETPRLDRSSSSCVLRSKVQECYDGFDGIVKFVDKSFWWE